MAVNAETQKRKLIKALQTVFTNEPTNIHNMVENILSMRVIGNKTHGDLGEVALANFIETRMNAYSGRHVGKDLYRSKTANEDVVVKLHTSNVEVPLSLKVYGNGPLQLSTDKTFQIYPLLESLGKQEIVSKPELNTIFANPVFDTVNKDLIVAIIYDETRMEYKMLSFSFELLVKQTASIVKVSAEGRRKHPIWVFRDKDGNYLAESRYGGKTANPLQRGFWTNTKHTDSIFDNITNGWVKYEENSHIIELLPMLLNLSKEEHKKIVKQVKKGQTNI